MKAVLVFCEGNQDAVFAQRSLGARGELRVGRQAHWEIALLRSAQAGSTGRD